MFEWIATYRQHVDYDCGTGIYDGHIVEHSRENYMRNEV